MAGWFNSGIVIGKASMKGSRTFKGLDQSHRDEYHSFFLQEEGTISIEIDFKKYKIKPSSIVYIHPGQVHRLLIFENAAASFCMINSENISPEYLGLLEEISPAAPLVLNKERFSILSEAASLCIKLSKRTQAKLYHSLLKNSCNTLVALIASQYAELVRSPDTSRRSGAVTRAFKSALERDFITTKRPAAYAANLNISTSYLNECVRSTTGHPVSHHIQQRIILEARRLLYHSDQSVKEIASGLGYDDYPYFSRLFTRVAGMTPLSFRNKNRD